MPIDWTDQPPTDQPWQSVRLLRCPEAAALSGITLDYPMSGCPTHYAAGRTRPCQGKTCKYCLDGHTARWHGYLPLYNPVTGRQIVLELTLAAASDYRRQISAYPSRAGHKLTVRRASKKPNARVLLSIEPAPPNGHPLPDPINVRQYLEHMWGVDVDPTEPTRSSDRPTEHKRHSLRTPPGDSPRDVANRLAEACKP